MNKAYDHDKVQSAWEMINGAQKITLLTHYRPDGDGISACSAMESVLLRMDKVVETIYPSESDFPPKREPKSVLVNEHKQTPDLLIAFDTANVDRLYYPDEFQDIPLINVDHHISNSINATITILNVETSSASEILYDLLKTWCPDLIDKYVSECLLYGIVYDTQVFQTQSTFASTLTSSSELMLNGANLFELKDELLAHKDPAIIKLWGHFMSNIQMLDNGKAVWASIKQEDLKKFNLKMDALAGFSNFLMQVSNIDVAVLLYETDEGEIKLSLRSRVADVNAMAKRFDGGGHKNASGAMVSGPIEEVEKTLIEELNKL